ncbi:hypothetical protein [Nocardia sp. NPDC020380]|uniref:hypothetical protein n=1 Tax=Nocardia sp. NPDC020380 TaxID=3364309 RepID=UPI003790F06A
MVLDEVWRRLDGVEALSGPHGGPLRRTVKLILDPLVIRPVQHPLCAGSILTFDGAALLTARINAAADVLRATAAWFTLLKQTRRALRITEGNAQDLYFQRCFELATRAGLPDPIRDSATAETALREIHDLTAGRTTQVLKEYLADPARARELSELIHTAWRRRPLTETPAHTAALTALLNACAAERLGLPEPGVDLDDLADARIGTHTGIRLWRNDNTVTAQELGLTLHTLPLPPQLGDSASKASLGLPLDRTIHERVFTVLQATTERADLPVIPELVTAEIARSCAPWALLDESLRIGAAAGVTLALDLRPIARSGAGSPADGNGRRDGGNPGVGGGSNGGSPAVDGGSNGGGNSAARLINSRWQREAYVLQARRMTVRPDGALAPDGAAGPLLAIAIDLQAPWRPYIRRLWARLHGRDVREIPIYETAELWDLLDGVARSVILDHRMRVKRALAITAVAAELDPLESRAG